MRSEIEKRLGKIELAIGAVALVAVSGLVVASSAPDTGASKLNRQAMR